MCELCELCEPCEETNKCGKCGHELSGQTFQGPEGLGMICADCQADLDRISGLVSAPGENLDMLIKNAIFRLGYVRRIHEFTAAVVLMELPKGIGATTEKIEAHFTEHTDDLKIERMDDGGMWRKVSA